MPKSRLITSFNNDLQDLSEACEVNLSGNFVEKDSVCTLKKRFMGFSLIVYQKHESTNDGIF